MFSSNSSQVSSSVNYIESVFSTYLYTGTGASLTITNNIDTSTYGGLIWIKSRSAVTDHKLIDTVRGVTKALISDTTGAQTTDTTGLTAFGTTGFTIGADANYNTSAATYASWTFRKQAKFFDVVTYTGDGVAGRTVAHNLGSVPGCIMVKTTSITKNWYVYHTSTGNTQATFLNLTNAAVTSSTYWNNTSPTSTVFSVGDGAGDINNGVGVTYVAYLFAHNAGGFGLTGTDNVISCGSFTTDGSGNATVNLGYEPQWLMVKTSSTTANWQIIDNMRGFSKTGYEVINANTSGAASTQTSPYYDPSATGFSNTGIFAAGVTVIYIAIRRGPMKVPTLGTSVFTPVTDAPSANNTAVSTGNLVDMLWSQAVISSVGDNDSYEFDRLRGSSVSSQPFLKLSTTIQETTQAGQGMGIAQNTGYIDNWFYWNYGGGRTIGNWAFSRAPSFFDEVCYTGTGSNTTFTHNLGAVPELMIVKGRSGATAWQVYSSALANTEYLVLNTTAAKATGATRWNSTTPTSSVFSIGTATETNTSAATYVAYLFATCTGVSKVGSYTGTGATQTISCGFAGGARFVLIKRTDTTGDWYVWDSARGMISGTDPYLLLNVQSSQVNANNVYATTGGFQIVGTGAGFNASAGTYIFLAIA